MPVRNGIWDMKYGECLKRISSHIPYFMSHIPPAQPRIKRSLCEVARGFTLIELMVVLAIVVIISLVVLVSASRFNSSILLRSLAYDVGLAVREAQLYGVAVKGTAAGTQVPCSTGLTSQFCAPYGVHFQAGSNQIIVFADTYPVAQPDGIYEPSVGAAAKDQVADQFQAQYGFTISNLCAGDGTTYYCANGDPRNALLSGSCFASCKTLNSLDISFRRPSPNAIITYNNNPVIGGSSPYSQALIVVSSPGGSQRSIFISLTGQIVVTGTGS